MATLQRLPPTSIVRAHVIGKIIFQEHPAPADPGRGNEPSSGALLECRWMQLKKGGSLLEIERVHGLEY
jgi:hypothetical protein